MILSKKNFFAEIDKLIKLNWEFVGMFNLILGKSDVKKRFLSVNFKTFTAEVEQKEEFWINSKKTKVKRLSTFKKNYQETLFRRIFIIRI